jgi:hypothetical protein
MQTRAGGRCELCGLPLMGKVVRHHRQRRAVGGDRLGNLLLLHDACHVRIHAHPEESRQAGWIVSSYELDPTAVPVAYQRARQVYLGDDGGLGAVAGP